VAGSVKGHARDYGTNGCDARGISQLFAALAQAHPELIPESFGADGVGFDEGKRYQAPGHTGDHTHVAIRQGVTAEQLFTAAGQAPTPGPPPPPSAGGAGGGGAVAHQTGITESGLRRFFLVIGGAFVATVGFLMVANEFSLVRGIVKATPAGRVAGAVGAL